MTGSKKAKSKSAGTMVGFDAGRNGRRLRAIPTSRIAINSQIRAYGRNVVARSRYLCANNSYASSAKEEFIAYMVGTGIVPSSLVENETLRAAINSTFAEWSEVCDADAITDFYGLQALIAGELFEGGELFVRFRPRRPEDGLKVPLQIQLLPTEMLPTDYNLVLGNRARIECGIQFSPIGQRQGYWFYTQHPGEMFFMNNVSTDKTFVPADQVLHLYRPMRAGQIRGVPMTLAGMTTLAMLDLYDDAELERKRLAALFGAFVTKGLSNQDSDDSSPIATAPAQQYGPAANGQQSFAMEPGATVELDWGQDVKFAEPADVGGNYEVFQKRQLLKIAAGFQSTYHGLTGDTGGANFSSMRADQLRYRRRIEAMQFHIMIYQFCRRVWNRWMDEAVLADAIEGMSATDYLAQKADMQKVKWTPPKWDWVNPVQDIAAEKMAVDSGFKSRSDVIEAQGEDPAATDQRIADDQARAEKLGIKFVSTKTGDVVSPTAEETAPDPAQNNPPPGQDQPPPPNARRRKVSQ